MSVGCERGPVAAKKSLSSTPDKEMSPPLISFDEEGDDKERKAGEKEAKISFLFTVYIA